MPRITKLENNAIRQNATANFVQNPLYLNKNPLPYQTFFCSFVALILKSFS